MTHHLSSFFFALSAIGTLALFELDPTGGLEPKVPAPRAGLHGWLPHGPVGVLGALRGRLPIDRPPRVRSLLQHRRRGSRRDLPGAHGGLVLRSRARGGSPAMASELGNGPPAPGQVPGGSPVLRRALAVLRRDRRRGRPPAGRPAPRDQPDHHAADAPLLQSPLDPAGVRRRRAPSVDERAPGRVHPDLDRGVGPRGRSSPASSSRSLRRSPVPRP